MENPYSKLPGTAFWRSAVADKHALDIAELWDPKHDLLPSDLIATAGSCFAQHIGRALRSRGYNWFDAEPAPPLLSEAIKKAFGHELFSFRTGNIYTAALLRQWVGWAVGMGTPPAEVWEDKGQFFDPFRPNIEPEGFETRDDLLRSRGATLKAIRRVIEESKVFVFTMGLTEAWLNKDGDYVYPMCPGTLHGRFDPGAHVFRNYRYVEVMRDMRDAFDIIRGLNKSIRFLLTVSPVPLTATASGDHVLVATTYSKSTLCAVAGDLAARPDTDYFPSYEIMTGIPFRSMFFEGNLRSVATHGVEFVMNEFFRGLNRKYPRADAPVPAAPAQGVAGPRKREGSGRDAECEEEMLAAFGPGRKK